MWLTVLAVISATMVLDAGGSAVAGRTDGVPIGACDAAPVDDRLRAVIGPMVGHGPAWMVDGLTSWDGAGPTKTVWVITRTTDPVRITGRRLDGPGTVSLRRGSDTPTAVLAIEEPHRWSDRPGNASDDVLSQYSFFASHVFYPSEGCWELTVRVGTLDTRIVRDFSRRD